MAYFPNGTECILYQEDWCDRCLHREDCPVWDAHLLYSYQECDNPASILHMLIPRSEDGLGNEKCRLFIDESILTPLQRGAWRTAQAQAAIPASEASHV